MPALSPELFGAVLDGMPVARLALRGPEDAPEALPIVVAQAAGALWSPIDGKPKQSGRRLGRLARIERAPQTMLLFDHYAADWRLLWWVRLACTTTIVTDDTPDWRAAVAALAGKYPQYQSVPMFKDDPLMLRFTWQQVSAWQASPDAISSWLDRTRQEGQA
jgi:PPOX class probable F420-dependent enzyme